MNSPGILFEGLFIFLLLILFSLSLLHFYWAAGGTWGFRKALPAQENGELLFLPKKIHSAIVGIGLLGILGLLWVRNPGAYFYCVPKIIIIVLWIIGAFFILRAMGDFKYVGFFKKIRNTEFSRLDTKFYSPLCLVIGILILILNYIFQECFIISLPF